MDSSAIYSRFVVEVYPENSDLPVYLESNNKIVNDVATLTIHAANIPPHGYSQVIDKELDIYYTVFSSDLSSLEDWNIAAASCKEASATLNLVEHQILKECPLPFLVEAIQLVSMRAFPKLNPDKSFIKVHLPIETYPLVTSASFVESWQESGEIGAPKPRNTA